MFASRMFLSARASDCSPLFPNDPLARAFSNVLALSFTRLSPTRRFTSSNVVWPWSASTHTHAREREALQVGGKSLQVGSLLLFLCVTCLLAWCIVCTASSIPRVSLCGSSCYPRAVGAVPRQLRSASLAGRLHRSRPPRHSRLLARAAEAGTGGGAGVEDLLPPRCRLQLCRSLLSSSISIRPDSGSTTPV